MFALPFRSGTLRALVNAGGQGPALVCLRRGEPHPQRPVAVRYMVAAGAGPREHPLAAGGIARTGNKPATRSPALRDCARREEVVS